MEVNAITYPHRLLGLLVNISEADFVSFDLELTGIPSHLPGKEPWKPRSGDNKRKTLEDRYQETKTAAERYNILQVGITCARFDYQTNKYVLWPYNIAISPLINERLDLNREICIQTGAASFLLKNGFDIGAPFTEGVQYLSREEATSCKQRAYDRFDKKNVVEDVMLKVDDVDSLDFVRRAREAITEWRVTNSGMLEVHSHTGFAKKDQPLVSVISRFEKRLVHQLVRAEFEDLVSLGKPDCIRIIRHDELREADNVKRMKGRLKESIAKQTGFRWVFEALAQGDINDADPFRFGPATGNMIIANDSRDIKDRFDRMRERLRDHQPVLVGHNMFTDLVYLYRTFVGPLPDTLSGFCETIHEMFPRIVDTKYLATHAGGDLNASPPLQEIAEKLEKQPLPTIETAAGYDKYKNKEAYHEAGFDSLLTATIMLRLAAKLGADGQEKSALPPKSEPGPSQSSRAEASKRSDNQAARSSTATVLPVKVTSTPTRDKNKKGKQAAKKPSAASRFQTRNLFESLRLNDDPASAVREPSSSSSSDSGEYHTPPDTPWQDEVYQPDTSSWVPLETRERLPMEIIPPFDSEFWTQFGNTLRVYGTEETVLRIADWKANTS